MGVDGEGGVAEGLPARAVEPVEDGVHARGEEREGVVGGGEHEDAHVGAAQRAQLAGLLEEAGPPLREARV